MATVTKSIGTGKDYTTIASWESDLDNDTPYDAGDDVIGEMYDETYDESVTINGGSTLGLNSITLSSESASNRHDGTAGSGARIVKSGNSQALVAASTVATVIEWIEVDAAGNDANGGGSNTGIVELQDSDSDINNCIVHDVSGRTSQFGPAGIEISTDGTGASEVNNCIVYDIQGARDNNISVYGIYCPNNISALFYNNTVYNTGHTGTGSTSQVKGMSMTAFETPNTEQKNNAIFGTFTDGTISDVQDLDNTVDVDATNATSDGTGSSGLQNLTASSQFVSLTAGSEDLHIVTGADLKDAGTDLGAITAAVDINGRNRDTEGDTWDIGAHEFVAVSGTTPKGPLGHPIRGPLGGPIG